MDCPYGCQQDGGTHKEGDHDSSAKVLVSLIDDIEKLRLRLE